MNEEFAVQTVTSRRNVLKFAGAGVLALSAGSLLAACGGSDSGGTKTAKVAGALAKPTPFIVGSSSGDNFLIDAVNVAQKQFEPLNLKVPKLVYPQSVPQGLQMIAAGAIDGAAMDTLVAMLSFANGKKGKRPAIIGMRMPVSTYSIIVGPGDWPAADASFADKVASLKGKKIGVTAIGAGTDHQLNILLTAAGLKTTDVTHVGIGQIPAAIAQIKAGRLDGYVGFTYGSGLSVATQVKGQMLIDFNDPDAPELLRNQQVCPIIMREDKAEEQTDVATAWLAAQWEAKTWIENDRKAAADLLNKGTFNGGAPTEAAKAVDFMVDKAFAKVNPNWKVSREGIDTMADVMDKLGLLKKGTVTYEDIVPAFARA